MGANRWKLQFSENAYPPGDVHTDSNRCVGSTIRAVLKTEITCDKHLYVWPSVTSVAASAHADAEAWQTKKNTAAAMDNTTVHQAG
jgi:hypothetical protein